MNQSTPSPTSTPLDLEFKKGDSVKLSGSAYSGWREAVILYLDGDRACVRYKASVRYDDYATTNVPLKDLRYACHRDGAPFERTVLDPVAQEEDGYRSGYIHGLAGQQYTAGGPHISDWGSSSCRHLRQATDYMVQNAAAWKKGWKRGQAAAVVRPHLNVRKPLRTWPCLRPVQYVSTGTHPGTYRVNIGDKGYVIDNRGSLGCGNYEFIVENYDMKKNDIVIPRDGSNAAALLGKNKKLIITKIARGRATVVPFANQSTGVESVVDLTDLWPAPEPAMLKRTGYMIVGRPCTSIEETLEEISKRWWEQKGRYGAGEFIISVEQTRTSGHDKWVTVKTGGPVEPLPEVVRRTDVVRYRPDGFYLGVDYKGPKNSADQLVEIDFENGKIVAVRHVR